MACAGCRQTRNVAQLHAVEGSSFLNCLMERLGVYSNKRWSPEAHAALYDLACSIVNLRGRQSAAQMRVEPFGFNPQRAADVAGNWPTMALTQDDPFWSCIGISRSEAVASLSARSGSYWDSVVAAGAQIAQAEVGQHRRRGSLAASACTLFLGSVGLLVWGS